MLWHPVLALAAATQLLLKAWTTAAEIHEGRLRYVVNLTDLAIAASALPDTVALLDSKQIAAALAVRGTAFIGRRQQ